MSNVLFSQFTTIFKTDPAMQINIRSLFRDIKEALTGTDQDFTQGSLSRAIFLLSVPMVLEMLMESTFAVVDIFFVSGLGSGAVATVGLTESLMTLVYAIGIGFSMSTTAVISRRIGEKQPEKASVAAVQAIILGIGSSFIFMIPGILFPKEILLLMGATPEVAGQGAGYTQIMLSGNMVIMLLFIINAIFRSAGDAATAMRVLILANSLNMVLDPCLIYGWGPFPEMGLTGAAVATNIGRGVAVIYQFWLLFSGRERIKIVRNQLKIEVETIVNLIRLSLGGIGQFLIATLSWVGLMRIMAQFGDNTLAGYTIAIRIIVFSILPSWGMSNAVSTLVGQNLGAGKPERAEKAVWFTGIVNAVFMTLIAILFQFIPEPLVRLFISDPEVVASGVLALRIISAGYFFYAFGMVMVQAFNGAGDTTTPTIVNFICFWMMEIPLAWFLAMHTSLEAKGVFWSITISESFSGFLGIMLFMRGRWRNKKV